MINDSIQVKGIIWEDTINYKKISTTLMMPKCSWKCDKECGQAVCQNWELAAAPDQTVLINNFMRRYLNNPITEAIVIQGLEPFDTPIDLYIVAAALKDFDCKDDLVIYTGYYKEEIKTLLNPLLSIPGRLIIKWGRYVPDQEPHYDPVLGVNLASDNQYGEVLK